MGNLPPFLLLLSLMGAEYVPIRDFAQQPACVQAADRLADLLKGTVATVICADVRTPRIVTIREVLK